MFNINEKLALLEKLDKFWFYAIIMPLIIAIITFYGAKLIELDTYLFLWTFFISFLIFGNFGNSIKIAKEQNNKFPKVTFSIFLIIKVTIMILYSFFLLGLYKSGVKGIEFVILISLIHIFFVSFFLLATFIQNKLFLKINNNFVNNFNNLLITSFVNPKKVHKGNMWTEFKEIQKELCGQIYVNNFRLVEDREKRINKNIEKIENIDLKFKLKDFTKTILAIGKMGSGKTEFFLNLVNENKDFSKFKREIFHDIKGDFTSKLFRNEKDFILNLFDNRGLNWDFWKDISKNETIALSFCTNLIVAKSNEKDEEKKDYWASKASELLTEIFMKIHFTYRDSKTSNEKWDLFFEMLSEYEKETLDNNTKKSVFESVNLAIEYLKLMAFDSKTKDNPFSIYEWVNKKNTRLFLLNNADYSDKLSPYFSGFLSALFQALLSKPDITDDDLDLSLILLDEYLSLSFSKDIRTKVLTQIRSKGGCLVLGVQFIDVKDVKHKQLMSSSTYAKFLFNVGDDETIKIFTQGYGNVEYEKKKISTSSNKSTSKAEKTSTSNSNSTSTSFEDKQTLFLSPELIRGIKNYQHLTLIDEKQLYYMGYTKTADFKVIHEHFIKRDMSKFYEWYYNIDTTNQVIIKKDDTDKLIEKDFAYKLEVYNELQRVKNNSDDEIKAVLDKYNLHTVDIDRFIEDFEKID